MSVRPKLSASSSVPRFADRCHLVTGIPLRPALPLIGNKIQLATAVSTRAKPRTDRRPYRVGLRRLSFPIVRQPMRRL